MNVRYVGGLDSLRRGITSAQDRIAVALTKAMRDLAKLVERNARIEIGRAGLGRRWQRAFFARAKPRVGYSLSPTMRGYMRVTYANIFERGGVIRPSKAAYLWIPLPTAPLLNRRRMTPKLYTEKIGPLHFIPRPGKPPLLAGDVGRRGGRLTVGSLKTGARRKKAGKSTVTVPVFVGVNSVTIRDRLDVDRVYRETAKELPKLFRLRMLEAR